MWHHLRDRAAEHRARVVVELVVLAGEEGSRLDQRCEPGRFGSSSTCATTNATFASGGDLRLNCCAQLCAHETRVAQISAAADARCGRGQGRGAGESRLG